MTGAELADEIERLLLKRLRARSLDAENKAAGDLADLIDNHTETILAALRSERSAVDVEAVERATIASYNSFFESQIGCCEPSWDELPDSHKDRMRDATRAALAAAQEGS